MNEPVPVAWRWKHNTKELTGRKPCSSDIQNWQALYLEDAIERKNAAIAELVRMLKSALDQIESSTEYKLGMADELSGEIDITIAKYDRDQ